MAELRFKKTITQEEFEILNDLATNCNRSIDNLAETLVLLAVDAHKNGSSYISLNQLGNINYHDKGTTSL